MDVLKQHVISAPALAPIDYTSDQHVIVAVDSSFIAVGWIVYQLNEKGQRRPSRYSSISWTERKALYSQSKLKLHGVFHALKSLHLHLIGLPTFYLEVDAKYIKGMLNNPNIQPNNTINQWIVGILLFNLNSYMYLRSSMGGWTNFLEGDRHQGMRRNCKMIGLMKS